MDTKIIIRMLGVFVFLILSAQAIEAVHFMCGVVDDSDDEISPGWRNITISNTDDFVKNTTCQINPEDNAFCCDVESIEGYTWSVGDTIYAMIVDDGTGYLSGITWIESTNNGFDTFEVQQLSYAVNILNIGDSVQNESDVVVNITTIYPYTNTIWYELDGTNTTICTSCNITDVTLSLADGNYSLKAYANDSDGSIYSASVDFIVNAVNDLPTIDSFSPSNTVTMNEGDSEDFSLIASDPDGTIPSYEWHLDSVQQSGSESNFTYTAGYSDAGSHTLVGYATDGVGNDSTTWSITVIDVPTCGDGTCNSNEACGTCPGDCGICPPTEQYEWHSGNWSREEKTFVEVAPGMPGLFKVLKGDFCVRYVLVFANASMEKVKVKVSCLKEGIDVDEDVLLYRFAKVEYENLDMDKVNEIIYSFKIEKSWMQKNNISIDDIRIRSLNTDEDIIITKVDGDETYLYLDVKDRQSDSFMIYKNLPIRKRSGVIDFRIEYLFYIGAVLVLIALFVMAWMYRKD